ncbi:MAG: tetratricopeptide repeat protein [Rubrivivax sp.]|jgi:putative thioredoxin|nr:tetratricopeptide repeat protein [Rubrivivax sp.]
MPSMMNPDTAAHSALSYDVTEADFRQTVLERSLEVPVLLDCWAPWCAPCRNLKPILEKLVQDYGGRFELAKLNTDDAPQISAALQIRSIPLVVLFVGGRPVDQFMGALPEGQVRAFLDKHLGEQADPLEALREDARQADPMTAESMLREGLMHVPGDMGLSGDLAERLIARDALDEAEKLLNSVDMEQQDDRHASLIKRIALARNKPPGNPAELEARIAANKKDFDARFALAAIRVYEGDFKAAFDQLLEVVMRDKAEWREKARLQLVEWFAVCTDADVVSYGRRYLGMYLN